jgi:glycosyltransferase involved in cell wall biosynthesis
MLDGVAVYRYPAPPEARGVVGYVWEYGYSMAAMFLLSLYVLLRGGIDIVHAHNPPDMLVLIGAFYKLFGKRFVFDHHDLAPELYQARFDGQANGTLHQGLLWAERLSCQLADHVIVTNESYRTIDMERGGVKADRISVVRNGPDPSQLRPVAPDPRLRQKGVTIMGYIGDLGYQDGLDYLLRALWHLVNDLGREDFFCVIVGNGDACDDLKELASRLELERYMWFTGWLSAADFVPLISAADICVDSAPSNAYNDRSTMIKMMEYMALQKPIVTFDLPEHRVTADTAARYVRPNDELAFAQALAQLMDDPASRTKMAELGRQRVETALAWSYSAQILLAAYESITAKPTPNVWRRMTQLTTKTKGILFKNGKSALTRGGRE